HSPAARSWPRTTPPIPASIAAGGGRPPALGQAGPAPRPGPGPLDPAPRPPYGGSTAPPPTGWYEYPLPPQKEVRVHDIVTIRVDVSQRQTSDGQVQRRRRIRWCAVLNDWITLNGLRSVKPAPQTDGDQRVQYNV